MKALFLAVCFLLGCAPDQVPEKGYRISNYVQASEKSEPEFTILYKNSQGETLRITAVCQDTFGDYDRFCSQLRRNVGSVIPESNMDTVFTNADKRDLGYVEVVGEEHDLLAYNPTGLFNSKGSFNHCNKDCAFLAITKVQTVK